MMKAHLNSRVWVLLALTWAGTFCGNAGEQLVRHVPSPLSGHPGNVFVAGQSVSLAWPWQDSAGFQLSDYDGQILESGRAIDGKVDLGALPVGYYEVRAEDTDTPAPRRIALAVLAPLKAPTPLDSPIALDVAMSWFYPEPKMPAVANLCALAGINWVRDRLNWAEMEPARGRFTSVNRYDVAARTQAAAGLRVLQVNHLSPRWASPESKRFPLDLRNVYEAYRQFARRWQGQVEAFEPWNEADIEMFGGHTGSEIASLQKAAWLGLKAGNPEVIVCQNVYALPNRQILSDFQANEAWPYFDTFNLHHYVPIDSFPRVYAAFRAVSAGKPLWVTECSMPVKWSGDEKLKEPSQPDLGVQAERLARVFAASLYEGSSTVFYFMLPHYAEGQTQFGILRADLTPRPAYVALAAVGRLLAAAKPLGRLKSEATQVRGFVFRAKPDGESREVLVAWTTNGTANLVLPISPLGVFDLLGRQLDMSGVPLYLGPAPVFVILPEGSADKLALDPPPRHAPRLDGRPSPAVLQALWPKGKVVLGQSAYQVQAGQPETLPVYLYNFSDHPLLGRFSITIPPAARAQFPREASVQPGERRELSLVLDSAPRLANGPIHTLRIQGDFGTDGEAVLSLRVSMKPPE